MLVMIIQAMSSIPKGSVSWIFMTIPDYCSALPGAENIEQPSKLDALSESMMDKTALNDIEYEGNTY